MHDIFYISKIKTPEYIKLLERYPTVKLVSSFEKAQQSCLTSFFWVVWDDLLVSNDFNFDYDPDSGSRDYIHVFLNGKHYDGISLFPKNTVVTARELTHRFFVKKKEIEIVASVPKPFEIFYIETYEDYISSIEKTTTDMFWMLNANIDPYADVINNFYISHHDSYARNQNHAFLNDTGDEVLPYGVFLLSKNNQVSKKEIEFKHIVDVENTKIIASKKVKYDIFTIESYEDYQDALRTAKTEMFWGISENIKIDENFDFSIYFGFDNFYDRHENHAFIHRVNDQDLYNGVFLFSKRKQLSKKEIEFRYLVNRKEWPIVASGPVRYDIFVVESYEDYLNAIEKSKTELFWATSNNLKIADDFKFDLYFSHDNEYDRKSNHAFIHKVDDEEFYNGIFLLSKHSTITKREVEFRHLAHKKEWPMVASGPVQYEKFFVKTYDDYLEALRTTKTEMFWIIPSNVIIYENFDFSTYFNYNKTYERTHHHAFLNGNYYDGVFLCSKHSLITKKEFDYGFVANKVETGITASMPKLFDVVFISYNESNAEENYTKLLKKIPNAKRVHGVKGIHNAHREAAKLVSTNMFWIVDGDADICDDFNFDYQVPKWEFTTVFVWRSLNSVNDLVYGYGGVKLFPTELTLNMDTTTADMTTSISKNFKPMEQISNITVFNTDPFSTWKSAFRECVKLSSKIIDRQKNTETESRLHSWKTLGIEKPYGEYSLKGAAMGEQFGIKYKGDKEQLKKINDFDWLYEVFNDTFK